jgi:hypothetical protein
VAATDAGSTPARDSGAVAAATHCPASPPKLLDPCTDTTGRGCLYGSGSCSNLFYCFEGAWAAAKQKMGCEPNLPDVCPSTIAQGTSCKAGSANEIESWTAAGAYPCLQPSGAVCTCEGTLACGATAPSTPNPNAPAKWNCTPAAPCPVRVPASNSACEPESITCSYKRFCETTTASCESRKWSLKTTTQSAP